MAHVLNFFRHPLNWSLNLIDQLFIRGQNFFQHLTFFKVSRFFLSLFFVSFPFQIRTIIYTPSLYLSGGFDYYTTGFIFLSEFFLLISFVCWSASFYKKEQPWTLHFGEEKITVLLLLFLAICLGTIFVAQDKLFHLLATFRLVECFLFYLMVVNEVLPLQKIFFYFFVGLSFQALTAFYQYLLQSSLGLQFLGEPVATAQTLGVAKIDFGGAKILRSFGTFPHANVLGGALCLGLIFCFQRLSKQVWIYFPLILLFGLAFIFSFSRSAFFALVMGFLVFISLDNHKATLRFLLLFVSLLLFLMVIFQVENIFFQRFLFEDVQSIQERTSYLSNSFEMLKKHPLGVGLGGFTLLMQSFSTEKILPWTTQPVHNVFLIITNELGLAGGILFLIILGSLFFSLITLKKHLVVSADRSYSAALLGILFAFLTIGLFDHYFFTLYQGQVLMFFYFALVSNFVSKSLLPRRNSSMGKGFLPSN